MKKTFIFLSLAAALAIGCSKGDTTPVNSGEQPGTESGEGHGDTGCGGIYSETFEGYSGGIKSDYSARESFTSTATGVTWTLDFGCINQTTDQSCFEGGNCFTLGGKSGKADNGQAVLSTSPLSDGITKLEFDYVANNNKTLEVQVVCGGSVVWTSGNVALENNGQNDNPVLKHLSFDIKNASSNAVLKFINVSKARRISIGNISWENATGEGGNGYLFEQSGDDEEDDDEEEEGIVMTTTSVLAEYYGDYYEAGTNDWCLTMSNDNTGECIYIEFLTDLSATTPEGTFTIDPQETFAKGTALAGYLDDGYLFPTFYYNEKSGEYLFAADGKLTVTKSGNIYTIKADFTDESGNKFSSQYTGQITIQEGELEEESTTTLTSNVTVTGISSASAVYYGDDFSFGTNDWLLYLANDDEELSFELFKTLGSTTPEGTYTIDNESDGAAGKAWGGYYSDYGMMPAYIKYTDTGMDYAMAVSGTVTISKNGTDYTVAVAVKDEENHSISANYTGPMEVGEGQYEDYDESASSKAGMKHMTQKRQVKAVLKARRPAKYIKK